LHRVLIVREMVQWAKECSPACEHRSAGKELCSLKPLLHPYDSGACTRGT